MDLESLKAALPQIVPFVGTLGITYEELSASSARLRLTDGPHLHNHVGGPHAGALFTLGESASGAVVVAAFGDRLGEVTPLVSEATVTFHRLAKGDVVAEARADRAHEDVAADLDRDGKAQWPVTVQLLRGDGTLASTMTVDWVLRRRAA